MAYNKSPRMGHINPLFDFQLKALIYKRFLIENKTYNRIRIPWLKHNIQTNIPLLGEVKIIRLKIEK